MSDTGNTLAARVAALPWYHAIDLPGGIRTPGLYDPAPRLHRYGLPASLEGKSVLDVGAWDGWFSFEAERRGAVRVVAADSFSWSGANWGSKESFELARSALGSRVEDEVIDVLDLSPERLGTFDVVLFLGVLYHMRYPQLAIDKVASVCHGLLIVETHVDLLMTRRPAIAFYPHQALQGDPTNFCGPNPAAVREMLARTGFTEFEAKPPANRLYNAAKSVALRRLNRSHRMVFHARRPDWLAREPVPPPARRQPTPSRRRTS
jgi:tRNA (mo5U34)-methyltransferase